MAVTMSIAAAAFLAIVVFGALFILKKQESDLNLAANFREMGISELANHNPLAAETLFARALSITDNIGAREQLIEARAQSPRLLWVHALSNSTSSMLAISSDGVLFAVATPVEVSVWSVPNRRQIRVFRMHLDLQHKPLATFGPIQQIIGRRNCQ